MEKYVGKYFVTYYGKRSKNYYILYHITELIKDKYGSEYLRTTRIAYVNSKKLKIEPLARVYYIRNMTEISKSEFQDLLFNAIKKWSVDNYDIWAWFIE